MGMTQSSRLPPPEPMEPPPSGEFSLSISPELVARLVGVKKPVEQPAQTKDQPEENPILRDLQRQRNRAQEHDQAQVLDHKLRSILDTTTDVQRNGTSKSGECSEEREACMQCLESTPGDCEAAMQRFRACVSSQR